MARRLVGLDIESYDPDLKTAGWSWKYGHGYILNTALYFEDEDRVEVIAGINNENCPYDSYERRSGNNKICALLTDPEVSIVGANLQYDIGWLLYEYGMSTYDVKCRFIDVLQAESILNEFDIHSLETVSWKYLRYGKTKDRIEDWVHENISAKGDFRKYLKDAPWDLLCEYVKGDAKNPVKIWRKQLTLLKQQGLCARCKLEFDCILPTLQMTMNGMPLDTIQKEKNLEYLTKAIDKLHNEFMEKYNLPKFRVTAPKDIASFCDMRGIPYRCKITLKGYNNVPFGNDYIKIDSAYAKAKKIVSSFRYVKSVPVAYVPKELADRTCELLTEEGFMWTCSPNVDKKFFASQRENYPEIALIADWKLAEGIKSKILGHKYDRFLTKNFKGEDCVRPQFKITDTISFRYSSNMPNCLAKGTKVLTIEGYKNIEDLTVSDYVFTHNGEIARVKNIWNKGKQIPICLTTDTNKVIICTKEHKFFTPKGWVEAKDLEEVYECKQVTVKQSRGAEESFELYSRESIDDFIPSCRRVWNNLPYNFSNLAEMCKQRRCRKSSQSSCINSKKENKWNERKEAEKLQRSLFRQEKTFNYSHDTEWENAESVRAQNDYGRVDRHIYTRVADSFTCPPYKWERRGQQERESVSVYTKGSCKLTQNITRIRRIEEGESEIEVYDIEIDSEDHSFIANGFLTHNCQQIPSKGGFTLHKADGTEEEVSFPKLTRALFTASKGCVFGKIDYGQIEYRLICNIACGESGAEVRRQYAENPHMDFHQYVVDLTGLSRKYAKNMSFGVSFGMGLKSMAESFGWTMERAEEISEQYHHHMPFVAPTLALVGDVAKQRGYIKTVCGSHARLPNPNKSYTMLNRYTQGSGGECLKSSIVQAYKEGIWKRLRTANTVHDELNFPYLVPTEECMIDFYRMAEIMRTSVKGLRVPLEAEIELGDNWASTKEIKDWLEIRDNEPDKWEKLSEPLRQSVLICEKLIKEGRVCSMI